MNLRYLISILLELVNQLRGIQLAIASSGLDNLGLLVQREVFPGETWAHVFLKQSQHFVVRNSSWVGEVVDTRLLVLGHENGCWQEIVQDRVGIGDVDYALVFGDLGDEVAGMKVVADWHAESENKGVLVCLHDLLNMGLRFRIERAIEIGLVGLQVSRPSNWVRLIILVNTTRSIDGSMDSLQETSIGQVQSTDDIASDGLLLVIFAPINIGTAGATSTVENVCWLDPLEFGDDSFSVLHAHCGCVNLLSLAFKDGFQMACNPTFSTPDQKDGFLRSHCLLIFAASLDMLKGQKRLGRK